MAIGRSGRIQRSREGVVGDAPLPVDLGDQLPALGQIDRDALRPPEGLRRLHDEYDHHGCHSIIFLTRTFIFPLPTFVDIIIGWNLVTHLLGERGQMQPSMGNLTADPGLVFWVFGRSYCLVQGLCKTIKALVSLDAHSFLLIA